MDCSVTGQFKIIFIWLGFFSPLEIITNSETSQSFSCRRPDNTIVISLLALQFLALLISLLRQVNSFIRAGWKLPVMFCSQPRKRKTIFNPSFAFDYRKMKLCLETAFQEMTAVKMLLSLQPEPGADVWSWRHFTPMCPQRGHPRVGLEVGRLRWGRTLGEHGLQEGSLVPARRLAKMELCCITAPSASVLCLPAALLEIMQCQDLLRYLCRGNMPLKSQV